MAQMQKRTAPRTRPEPKTKPLAKKGDLKLGLTKGDDMLKWWTQAVTLGIIRYDGKEAQILNADAIIDWWAHAFTLGIVTTRDPDKKLIEKGGNILEHLTRNFTLAFITWGQTPTTLNMNSTPPPRPKQKSDGRGKGWHREPRPHRVAALKGKRERRNSRRR